MKYNKVHLHLKEVCVCVSEGQGTLEERSAERTVWYWMYIYTPFCQGWEPEKKGLEIYVVRCWLTGWLAGIYIIALRAAWRGLYGKSPFEFLFLLFISIFYFYFYWIFFLDFLFWRSSLFLIFFL